MVRYAWIPNWTILAALLIVAVQVFDREPPFSVLQVFPASARPGETVTIQAEVWRDTSRHCSATMGRSVFDSQRARFDFPVAQFSAALIANTAMPISTEATEA